ncbi:putative short-chain dehydrogenase/oxidoreductase [Hypoxylon sp. FL0890]|nr:putative short-chain dehydrogenase/oxidoreductase [Hypoxylon sp. FL0890]
MNKYVRESAPLYKKALIIGATSGIGSALAAKLHAEGTSVILASIPSFATIVQEHPDLDAVILNAGIQRPFDFARLGSVDLGMFGKEWRTDYVACVHLATAFLPHLQRMIRRCPLVPTLVRAPGYNASKAALHSWVTNLRQQLRDAEDTGIKVVKVFPPAVQTELHDTKHQPDLVNGGEIGLPLDAFTEQMYEGLIRGDKQFAIGPHKE